MADEKDLDKPLGEAGYRALVDERAANKDLRAEITSLKQELEVAQGESDTWKQRVTEIQAKLTERDEADALSQLREEVATEKSSDDRAIPAHLLSGKTREELEASADQLLAYLGETTGPNPPQAAPTQGQSGATGGSDTEVDALSLLGFGDE